MLRLDYVKTNPEKLERNVRVKSKQSNRQGGQGSKKLYVEFSQAQLKVASRFVLRKVKVKSKQSDWQEDKSSKMLLVEFSKAQLKDKTLLIQHKSTRVRVLFSKIIKV
ncbi:hypothetical protein M0802_016383 [Mischocyttarus mexicanus]|nr:hypothetical protein M0802_016383 [Mischocyttarus mexicanus]